MPAKFKPKRFYECTQWPLCDCECDGCKSGRSDDHCKEHANGCHLSCD